MAQSVDREHGRASRKLSAEQKVGSAQRATADSDSAENDGCCIGVKGFSLSKTFDSSVRSASAEDSSRQSVHKTSLPSLSALKYYKYCTSRLFYSGCALCQMTSSHRDEHRRTFDKIRWSEPARAGPGAQASASNPQTACSLRQAASCRN